MSIPTRQARRWRKAPDLSGRLPTSASTWRFSSCGTKIGKVDRVEGDSIELTKNDSPDGQHHRIPLSWVAKVHDHIHLSKDHKAVQGQWKPA